MKKYSIYLLIILLIPVWFSACQDSLLDTNPYDSISSNTMWTSENLAEKGVLGIYSSLLQSHLGKNVYEMEVLGICASNRDVNKEALLFGKATSGDGLFSGYWQDHYEGIHRANDAISHLPSVPGIDPKKEGQWMAEAKFLRAFFYYKLNIVYKGVPLYLKPIEMNECTRGRETEAKIWNIIIQDLTDCIHEPNFPNKYAAHDANYGRVTKGAAYALRGKAYLWMAADLKDGNANQYYAKAEADFKNVGTCGYALFTGDYQQLFKEANEQSPEMVLSIQCKDEAGLGNDISWKYGSDDTYGYCWNTYILNPDFVDSYENKDGSKFDWDKIIPGYNQMTAKARAVYFLRDGLTQKEMDSFKKSYPEADMSKYLPVGNEARILKAYSNRDPRLTKSIITPYSTYLGAISLNNDRLYTALSFPF